jgi:hypothetical protein
MCGALRIVALSLAAALALGEAGCKRKDKEEQGEPIRGKLNPVAQNDLQQIAMAFHGYCESNPNRGPAKAEDLAPYFENNKRLLDLLKSGDIVFPYNVSLHELSRLGGLSNVVLAYDKGVPTEGGYVVMADAAPRRMSADEFKKATVAKGK